MLLNLEKTNEFDSIIAFANTINDTVEGNTDELRVINNSAVDYSNLREDVVGDSLSNETILSNVEGNNGFFTAKRCVNNIQASFFDQRGINRFI